ncbi:MAG: glutamine-hydrolyzing GMP synthase [Gammaproteobacteria bacterium]|nr:MAG: glutamine-hydrolyzing GMP synthase [Gammaproteobacteria bacterium]PIE35827.1 MAG: glutamine-hydrolyzing GMP synthase [Gammaproteobacteria bacterium]
MNGADGNAAPAPAVDAPVQRTDKLADDVANDVADNPGDSVADKVTADALHEQRVLIIDFGGQTTQLIARRVREAGVYCEILPWQIADDTIRAFRPRGVILSGGPESVAADGAPVIPAAVLELEVPILGICYGMQALVQQSGGEVRSLQAHSEFGHAEMQLEGDDSLLAALAAGSGLDGTGVRTVDVWMSHGDRVEVLPEGYRTIGRSANAPHAAIVNDTLQRYGIQFHPEVTHTSGGDALLTHFVRAVCGLDGLWTAGHIVDDAIASIRQQVGDEKVLLALSGGVDSSVVAALMHKAIGDQLVCVFVDNGLLRLHEGDQVMRTFAENMGVTVIRVDAEARFLTELHGVADPEEKRRIIGRLFIEVFEEEAGKLSDVAWLAQGTIYPDVIESAASAHGSAHLIKSHHNVGGLPSEMRLKLIEPLRELFKDEVRKIGVDLGLPAAMVYRHPFPGPGLGVRVLGEVQKEYADILREADAIFMRALRESGWYDKVSQAFAVFLPVKSVGVTGDGRRHDFVIALRAVETIDFMTARAARLPWELLESVSRDICNACPRVSRVVYDTSSKPPATIEWE